MPLLGLIEKASDDDKALIAVSLRAMQQIWESVPKTEKGDEEYVVYEKDDIPYLYYSGLVDTAKYTLEEWKQAFVDALGEDGRYWVSNERMLWLGKFRYNKIVNDPFDPLKMRTGRYTVERLWQVYERSIIPSCSLPKEFIEQSFNTVIRQRKPLVQAFSDDIRQALKEGQKLKKEDFPIMQFEKEGNEEYVVIEHEHLVKLKEILDKYPSPRRRLELGVYDAKMGKLQDLANAAQSMQKSTFEAGKDFRETAKKNLKDILVKASDNVTAGRKTTGEEIAIADLQKNRRPPSKF